METLHKQVENYRKYQTDAHHYIETLESLLDDCHRKYQFPNHDFRATRPQDPDMGQEDDSDVMMGGDDNEQGSDDGNDPTVMAICIPPQSLQVR